MKGHQKQYKSDQKPFDSIEANAKSLPNKKVNNANAINNRRIKEEILAKKWKRFEINWIYQREEISNNCFRSVGLRCVGFLSGL
ncbi:hypothetical protein CDL12_22219 [Handroanthus impetiginosus]|uniref:Uncharacterized protein n=1 Tax=Handroanthus impetiginosus TaxID=429701 RepID=A0A2G9GIY0_9LAMI|nr:hypothetical protein CDL12_22219 [Handroanthus impetiginosus]